MNFAFSPAARAFALASLAFVGTAHAAPIPINPSLGNQTINISVPGIGTGTLKFDGTALSSPSGGYSSAPLTSFSFTFNSQTYTLAESTPGDPKAWVYDPGTGTLYVGFDYTGTQGANTILFTSGFGPGDLGFFSAEGGLPVDPPVALTEANFTLQQNVPEPDTLACLLLGLGLLAGAKKLERKPF